MSVPFKKLSYKQSVEYLNSFIDYEKTTEYLYNQRLLNVDRMLSLLQTLGNPHEGLTCIHIAGTNGKGSTAAIITSILRSAGFKTGLYTSPHLVSFRERIRIGSELISKDEFCSVTTELKTAMDAGKTDSELGEPTFFEAGTALAFLFFARKKVDFAVLEVGLGGRLDATNVIKPAVCVITSIDFDHTDKLGRNLAAIAEEKAKIIKPNIKVVAAPQNNEVLKVIEKECRSKKAKLVKVKEGKLEEKDKADGYINVDKVTCRIDGSTFDIKITNGSESCHYKNLDLYLPGRHQVTNAATAIGTIKCLNTKVDFNHIKQGLSEVKWPGRLEIIGGNPLIVLDVAHNPSAAKRLKESLNLFFPDKKVILVLGVSSDKDIGGIAAELCPLAKRIILTQAAHPRAADPYLLKEKLYEFTEKLTVVPNIRLAIEEGKKMTGSSKNGILCITGSFYTIGEARQILNIPV